MTIRTIAKSYYNTNEVIGLTEALIKLIDESLLKDDPTIKKLRDKLAAVLKTLKESKGKVPANTHTIETETADKIRDLSFRAFVNYIYALTLRQNETVQQTAVAVWEHIKKFDRGLIHYGYADESVELDLFITEMEKPDTAEKIDLLHGTDCFNELKQSEANFKTVYKTWFDEETEKQALISVAETRDACLKMLIVLINALNSLEAAETPHVSELNIAVDQAVEDFESKARARRTRRMNESEEDID